MLDRELKRVIAKVSVATLIVIAMFAALAVVLMQNYDVGTQTAYANSGEGTPTPVPTYAPQTTPDAQVHLLDGNTYNITNHEAYVPFNSDYTYVNQYGIQGWLHDHDTYPGGYLVDDESWPSMVCTPNDAVTTPGTYQIGFTFTDDNKLYAADNPDRSPGTTNDGTVHVQATVRVVGIDVCPSLQYKAVGSTVTLTASIKPDGTPYEGEFEWHAYDNCCFIVDGEEVVHATGGTVVMKVTTASLESNDSVFSVSLNDVGADYFNRYINLEKTIRYTAVNIDLDIVNGGNDLDNGENGSRGGERVSDNDEETTGAYILVNWDDDDGDGVINSAGTDWDLPPVPDLEEDIVENEDNLGCLFIDIAPAVFNGYFPGATVEFEVSGPDADKIRLWRSNTKETEVTLESNKLTWDLSDNDDINDLFYNYIIGNVYIEGIAESSVERGVSFTLRFKDSGGLEICSDTCKATIVMIKLGTALHREMAGWPSSRGHTGILVGYQGECKKSDFLNASKYTVCEMQGGSIDDCVYTNWSTFHGAAVYFGQYDNSPTYVQRLKILKTAQYIYSDTGGEIDYCLEDVLEPNAWDGGLKNIESLRCDGLTELCYEWKDLTQVWGKVVSGSTHYSLPQYTEEHNEFLLDWKKHLFPATQCGYESTYKGQYWDTRFTTSTVIFPTLGDMQW